VEHHAYIPESSSLPVSKAKSWRSEISICLRGRNYCGTMGDNTIHRLLSKGASEAPPAMTDALTVSGTVWRSSGLAIQLKYYLVLLGLKIKNPVICEM